MFYIYSDETKQTSFLADKISFWVITSIYWRYEITEEINKKILSIVKQYWSQELKFSNVRSNYHVKMIQDCLNVIFPLISNWEIRIYSVCRNNLDQRYENIKVIDEDADFDIMMYHCVVWIARRIWIWQKIHCFPDQRNQSKREKIKFFLSKKKIIKKETRDQIKKNSLFHSIFSIDETISIESICWVCSHEHWLVQLSDIISWLIWFSCISWKDYHEWLYSQWIKDSLFWSIINPTKSYWTRQVYKFKTLEIFDKLCKQYKLQISLKSENKLVCKKDNGFYIHHYKSQSNLDKAPGKKLN